MSRPEPRRFAWGQLTSTPGALREFTPEELQQAFRRHLCNDWGEVDAGDRRANDHAVRNGERILSAYTFRGKKLWIITEADRSYTTFLLPQEY